MLSGFIRAWARTSARAIIDKIRREGVAGVLGVKPECVHPRMEFNAGTGAQPAENGSTNIEVGVVALCRDCGRAWTGEVVAGLTRKTAGALIERHRRIWGREHGEDVLETAYWMFDGLRKRQGMPVAERDAFKIVVAGVLRSGGEWPVEPTTAGVPS